MKRYCIKTRSGKIEYFDIIAENNEEFKIRLYRLSDGSEKIVEETMSRNLFNTCVKTGYIYEMEKVSTGVA